MNQFSKLIILAASATMIGTLAYAAQGGIENDAFAIVKAKTSLSQAVTLAEQHANGKAARAEYENSKHGWVYDVEVIAGGKVFDVTVDADKGTVISSTEDKVDRDDDQDKDD